VVHPRSGCIDLARGDCIYETEIAQNCKSLRLGRVVYPRSVSGVGTSIDAGCSVSRGLVATVRERSDNITEFVLVLHICITILSSVLTLLNQFYDKLLAIMSTAKQEVESLLSKLPDDCSIEDIQYHIYVIEKVRNGLEAADSQGTVSQEEVERRLGKWLTE
jgi:hypothetical protein